MPKITCYMCALLVILCCFASAYGADVRVRAPQSLVDVTHGYYISLLQLALDKTADEYGVATVVVTDFNVTQGRALTELAREQDSRIDVDWAATSLRREQDLLPVRVPLLGGLLGYRVPVIRVDSVGDFSAIRAIGDLRHYKAVQGMHWPDSDILEFAGIPVERVPLFESMYAMLKEGRSDFFPRGIAEAYAEVEETGGGALVVFDALLIQYPMPMYFFTSHLRPKLAVRLEKGLRAAIHDGSFSRLFRSHPATAPLFPLSRFVGSRVIHLENPNLPPTTLLGDSSLWISVGGPLRPH
ncbi:hypothetical protein [Oleidesulfovibrio sp.]|uniref:hypothetical protein n=1 Tax=Oleidesulfovibrio sp. TaxID=2909707 RepID=UPI003A882B0C